LKYDSKLALDLNYCFVIRICTNTTDANSGAGTAYPSGALEFTPSFSGVRVT